MRTKKGNLLPMLKLRSLLKLKNPCVDTVQYHDNYPCTVLYCSYSKLAAFFTVSIAGFSSLKCVVFVVVVVVAAAAAIVVG